MKMYKLLFEQCTSTRSLSEIHAHLLVSGHFSDALAATMLLQSYSKLGSVQSASLAFKSVPKPDSFMCSVMVKIYTQNLFFEEAIGLFRELQSRQPCFNAFVFPSIIKSCSGLQDLVLGRMIHGSIVSSGYESDCVVETSLLRMYGELGGIMDALRVFDKLSWRDVVVWSTMVSCYIKNGRPEDGLEAFRSMSLENVVPDRVAMLSASQACGELGCLKLAKSVHGSALRRDIESDGSLENSLLVVYSKCGDRTSAEKLFNMVSPKSVISWSGMISCYNQMYCFRQALELFVQMQNSEVRASVVTMVSILRSCTPLRYLRIGMSVHAYLIRNSISAGFDDLVGSVLINFYASFGRTRDCCNVFETVHSKTQIMWNSLIKAYAQNGFFEEALAQFADMQIEGLAPDSFSIASSLSVCGDIGSFELGSQIHSYVVKLGFEDNEFVQNSFIDMCCKCGVVDIAYGIFDGIKDKGLVTWNSMISGLSANGSSVEAILLFDKMYSHCLDMDTVTLISVIQACSHLNYLEKGRWAHNKLITSGLKRDVYISTALIDMYAKCGVVEVARRVFDSMTDRNVFSWSAMIASYGIHGLVDAATSLFSQMIDSGIQPNKVTFMSILSACSHVGSVEKGLSYFNLMKYDLHIEPDLDHYACVIDLLSRAGHLDSAYDLAQSMPKAPSPSIWGSLLGGCRIHRKADLASAIQSKILELEPSNSGYYLLLSNIYAEAGNWEDYRKVRLLMKDVGLRKVPGFSTVELNRRIYRFIAGDTSHHQTKEIYSTLKDLKRLACKHGCTFDGDSYCIICPDNHRKDNNVESHSEKLAIAFGIINTSPGTTIRISKNLRVCVDCHTFTKSVSKITNREIIMRDLNRFHHFKGGNCSCSDYW